MLLNDDKKLNTGLTAAWLKNCFCEKYTCPTLDVDSPTPPLMPMIINGNRSTISTLISSCFFADNIGKFRGVIRINK